VSDLVAIAVKLFPANLAAEEIQHRSVAAYFASGIQVIDEMLLIGAVVCVLSVIPALFLQGNGRVEADDLIAKRRVLERETSPGR
jgi:hypothetical protein